ncbi:TPA: hydroxyacid dehydrogenase, partial [Candidatus Acetothermia bacterium]|nr:hydroxyacid dehydrogenase [Candidatus Acetothermia bacterium]
DRLVREGSWPRVVGRELCGKTLGLVGMGAIGRQVAQRAAGFDMNVLAFDQHRDEAFAAQHGIEYTELDDLLVRSDFVSIHLPLVESTRGLIGEPA